MEETCRVSELRSWSVGPTLPVGLSRCRKFLANDPRQAGWKHANWACIAYNSRAISTWPIKRSDYIINCIAGSGCIMRRAIEQNMRCRSLSWLVVACDDLGRGHAFAVGAERIGLCRGVESSACADRAGCWPVPFHGEADFVIHGTMIRHARSPRAVRRSLGLL